MEMKKILAEASLYLIYTDALSALPLEQALDLAVRGGVEIVQIREKGSRERRIDLVRRALERLRGRDIPVIVNDDPEVAVLTGAQGVHVGPGDMAPGKARTILAPGMALGISTSSLAEVQTAVQSGADYIGVGTVFKTATRTGKTLIGPEEAARIGKAVPIPAFPIGGIDATGAARLAEAGIARAAVCTAIIGGRDMEERAAGIRKALERNGG
jgi:thiamine-phosphate pyrophosphorylase